MSKTFRLFISSTFNDFRQERKVLQTKVFPEIKKYASSFGYSFQPIDLRWGVSDEAQLDQKTLELCLEEVRACKTHIYPNFLVMLGDRYGWVPLPYAIEEDEFNSLTLSSEEKQAVKEWYKLDSNHIPASYILKERTEEYEDFDRWVKVENKLRLILQTSANNSKLTPEQKIKYFQSATEAEVQEGILLFNGITKFQKEVLSYKDDTEHIFGFFRNVDKITQVEDKFITNDYDEAQVFKLDVKDKLVKSNILEVDTTQVDKDSLDETYIQEFQKRMTIFLKEQIDIQREEEQEEELSKLDKELRAQSYFATHKRKNFLGQEELRTTLSNYINSSENEALLIYGQSGSGKSALMAKAMEEAENALGARVVFRFVGATPHSSSSKEILTSIFKELGLEFEEGDKEESFEEFSNRAYDALCKISNPTTIFIDAVDQLGHDDQFLWLPKELPSKLKIIISALNDMHYKTDSTYYQTLKEKLSTAYEIPVFNEPLQLLHALLSDNDRTLDSFQTNYFLERYAKVNSPLYVYIAAQEIKSWKSGDTTQDLADTQRGIIEEYISNLTEFYHHDKEFVQRVLGYLYASRDGLSESELLTLLAQDEEFVDTMAPETWHDNINKELPLIHWSRLQTALKPFLSKKTQDGEELMYFFHREFEDIVKKQQNQKEEHESIIKATQDLILKTQDEKFDTNRWGKLYAIVIAEYELRYGTNSLFENHHRVFLTNVFNWDWQRNYMSNLLDLSNQYASQNKISQAKIYTEHFYYMNTALFTSNAQRWAQSSILAATMIIDIYTKLNLSTKAIAFAKTQFDELEMIYKSNQSTFGDDFTTFLKVLGTCYLANKDYTKATQYLDKSFDLYLDSNTTSRGILAYLNDLATAYYHSNKLDEAKFYFEKALETIQALDYINDATLQASYITIVSNLTNIYLDTGLTQEDLNLILSTQQTLQRLYNENNSKWLNQYIPFMNSLSKIYRAIGDRESELDCFNKLYPIVKDAYFEEQERFALDYNDILFNIGGLQIQLQEWNEASYFLSKALEVCKTAFAYNPDPWIKEYENCLVDLAGVYGKLQDTSMIIAMRKEKVTLYQALYEQGKFSYISNYSQALMTLVNLYKEQQMSYELVETLTTLYYVTQKQYGENSNEANSILQAIAHYK